jgi:hypothetical protein
VAFLFATKLNESSYEDMIVLTTSNSAQTFSFVPRKTGYNVMQITDEIENTTQSVSITSSVAGDYTHSITATFDLVEGRSYLLVLKNGSNIIYRDKIYCTDSPLTNFSVNYNQYTSNVSNNEFIVI